MRNYTSTVCIFIIRNLKSWILNLASLILVPHALHLLQFLLKFGACKPCMRMSAVSNARICKSFETSVFGRRKERNSPNLFNGYTTNVSQTCGR